MGNALTRCCRRLRARVDGDGHADLYAVLGVAPTASRREIDAAMRRLKQTHGPGSGGDAARFDEATRAYAVLSDPWERVRYDEIYEDTRRSTTDTDYVGVRKRELTIRRRKREPVGEREAGTSSQRSSRGPPTTEDIHAVSLAVSELSELSELIHVEAQTSGVIVRTEYASALLPTDGFRAAQTSYGVWNQRPLQQNRIPSDELTAIKPLSLGAFGDVWLGQIGQRPVVLKQLKREDQTQANAVVFATEIVRMVQLSHPKITTFVGVEWTKQWETRVVVEYLPRGDLRTLLQSPKAATLGWADFKCQVAIDVVDALMYLQTTAAANGVMESFTSRNVLLDGDDGSSKLSLFAAARGRQDQSASPHYVEWVAPEILLGEDDAAKQSIYSLGVLLCELDTTQPPFWDAVNPDGSPMSSYKIAQLVAMGKLWPSVSNECPEGIASLASECLAFDSHARPTAASIAYRLRDLLKSEL